MGRISLNVNDFHHLFLFNRYMIERCLHVTINFTSRVKCVTKISVINHSVFYSSMEKILNTEREKKRVLKAPCFILASISTRFNFSQR